MKFTSDIDFATRDKYSYKDEYESSSKQIFKVVLFSG